MSLPINQFTEFYQQLGNVQSNLSDCNILCLGDSITSGWFDAGWNNNYRKFSYPALLGQLLATKFGVPVATQNYASADTNTGGSTDGRIVRTGGFNTASGPTSLGGICFQVGATGTLTFTPGDGLSYDTVDIYVMRNSNTAQLTVSVNGGTAQSQTIPNDNNVHKYTFTGTASTTASVVINWVAANFNVYAVMLRSSTIPRINVMNNGVGGALTTAFSSPMAQSIINAISPQVAIVSLGVNDAVAANYVSVYQSNMQNLINSLLPVTTGVIVSTPATGIRGGAVGALEVNYAQNVIQTFQQGYPIADFNKAIGANTNFFANSDHPNQAGYNLLAQTLNSLF